MTASLFAPAPPASAPARRAACACALCHERRHLRSKLAVAQAVVAAGDRAFVTYGLTDRGARLLARAANRGEPPPDNLDDEMLATGDRVARSDDRDVLERLVRALDGRLEDLGDQHPTRLRPRFVRSRWMRRP